MVLRLVSGEMTHPQIHLYILLQGLVQTTTQKVQKKLVITSRSILIPQKEKLAGNGTWYVGLQSPLMNECLKLLTTPKGNSMFCGPETETSAV